MTRKAAKKSNSFLASVKIKTAAKCGGFFSGALQSCQFKNEEGGMMLD
jgi:hypothetical protein